MLKIPFDKYKFSVITFEHEFVKIDKQSHAGQVRKDSREFFAANGYVLVAGDVAGKKDRPFEDWYVSQEIADSEYFKEHFIIAPEFNDLGENYILNL